MQRFRGGLVFKAHSLLYHSTLGLRVIQKKRFGISGADPLELADELEGHVEFLDRLLRRWSNDVKSSS